MKQYILLSAFVVTLFSSCIGERTADCYASMNLMFKYKNSNRHFDEVIGNDVILHLYQDKELKSIERIPYARIKNGNAYPMEKRYSGHIDLVAWAVPSASGTETPTASYGYNYDDFLLEHRTRSISFSPIAADLFLGTETLQNNNIDTESTHVIYMAEIACLVQVNVENAANTPNNEYSVIVEGVMSSMSLQREAKGEMARVFASLNGTDEANRYTTNFFGVLPSAEEQTVSVSLYHNGNIAAKINTGEKAVSAAEIIVNINLGVSVQVIVDGWDIHTIETEWI